MLRKSASIAKSPDRWRREFALSLASFGKAAPWPTQISLARASTNLNLASWPEFRDRSRPAPCAAFPARAPRGVGPWIDRPGPRITDRSCVELPHRPTAAGLSHLPSHQLLDPPGFAP